MTETSEFPYDTIVMLMERVEQLEWGLQCLLGSDMTIRQGMKVSSVLLNQDVKTKHFHGRYLIQVQFPEYTNEMIDNAVHTAGENLAKIEQIKCLSKKNVLGHMKLAPPLNTEIVESFFRKHPIFPQSRINDIRMVHYDNSIDYVITWIIRAENPVSIDEVVGCIRSTYIGTGLDVYNFTVYPLSDEVYTSTLLPIISRIDAVSSINVSDRNLIKLVNLICDQEQPNDTQVKDDDDYLKFCRKFIVSRSCPSLIRDHYYTLLDSQNVLSIYKCTFTHFLPENFGNEDMIFNQENVVDDGHEDINNMEAMD